MHMQTPRRGMVVTQDDDWTLFDSVVTLVVIEISQDVLGWFEDGEFEELQGWDVDPRHDNPSLTVVMVPCVTLLSWRHATVLSRDSGAMKACRCVVKVGWLEGRKTQ
ncbi:uncharacterized protein FPRO_06459 [Fusarium proliferatum ET1]|uniref:Uncharacterized protein n=1 Tax=Fusarium proliferatum (strain ET1) TaxID=1227346 RepID=A0A1L7VFS5_FUSPR|nr:uncharacterized protein FPRO_06459 [Fusarium proliferatum ET1]CZR38350.1 uncharacterized protein FPRO_06459 [Fusarium proliferatum ET1]